MHVSLGVGPALRVCGGAERYGRSGGAERYGRSGGAERYGRSGGAERYGRSGGAERYGRSGGAWARKILCLLHIMSSASVPLL